MIKNIIKIISKETLPALKVEKILDYKTRKGLSLFFGFIAAFLLLSNALVFISSYDLSVTTLYFVSTLLAFVSIIPGIDISNVSQVNVSLIPGTNYHISLIEGFHFWNGILLISLFSYILVKILNVFVRSFHYKNLALSERGERPRKSYYVDEVFVNARFGDIVDSYLNSRIGIELKKRLNISNSAIDDFISKRQNVVDYRSNESLIDINSIPDLSSFLYDDIEFRSFLNNQKITLNEFLDAAVFVEYYLDYKDNEDRFYGKNNLSSVSSLKNRYQIKNSTYLNKYLKKIEIPLLSKIGNNSSLDLSKLQEVFSRNKKNNLLLIGNNEYSSYDALVKFYKYYKHNYRNKNFKGKEFYYFDIEKFFLDNNSIDKIDTALFGLFGEMSDCSDIILVISNFDILINHSKKNNIDLLELLKSSPFNKIQIIATVNIDSYNRRVEKVFYDNDEFASVNIQSANKNNLYGYLIDKICEVESEEKIIFTIQSIDKIINITEKYYVCGLFIERIKGFIEEIGQYAKNNNLKIVDISDIDRFFAYFPDVSTIKEIKEDKINIANLANSLKKEISGQDYAISSIVRLLKDFNSNISEKNKPASFIIFGPDALLKLEMISSLSRSITGHEDNIVYLDMNDFRDENASYKLLTNNSLTSKIKDNSISFVVLNDFEKAHSSIRDLINRIIDAGTLPLLDGSNISLKNSIIIALSSIGSTEVYINESNNGFHDRKFEEKVIDSIKSRNTIDPNIIDSFGERILFKAVSDEDIRKIVVHLLTKLSDKLGKEGITLIVDDYLVDSVMRYSIDSSFGIAPVKKAVYEIIEKRINELKISGTIAKGNIIKFKEGEIV